MTALEQARLTLDFSQTAPSWEDFNLGATFGSLTEYECSDTTQIGYTFADLTLAND